MMKNKLLAVALTAIAMLSIAGCSTPAPKDAPAIIGEGGWEIEYIIVNPADNLAIPCLWHGRSNGYGTYDCDWGAKSSTIPAGSNSNTVGEGGWEIEYIQYNNRSIPCLWNDRTNSKTKNISCDFTAN